jgi:transposase InsO family protein
MEEAAAMRGVVSPSTARPYPLTMICAVYRVPRSSLYLALAPLRVATVHAAKRGPRTALRDAEVVEAIRAVLAATPFHGEGYRKVRARLAHRGLPVGGKRVLRLMRAHQLLAPRRLGPPNGDPAHAGTITTTRPDEMWDTDASRFYTEEDGWCWFFGAIDHCVDELVGWHTAKIGDRSAAPEPWRQGVRHAFGGFAKDVARGLRIRCDWGPQSIADAWINEVKWLGMTITPSYVGEPECNGVIERFMRTLKEQCLYLHRFQSLAEARRTIGEFIPATTPSGSSSGSGTGRRWRRVWRWRRRER